MINNADLGEALDSLASVWTGSWSPHASPLTRYPDLLSPCCVVSPLGPQASLRDGERRLSLCLWEHGFVL